MKNQNSKADEKTNAVQERISSAGDKPSNIAHDHWEDLKKSGLTSETIKEAGLRSCERDEIAKILGYSPQGVETAIAFPYPNCGDFTRLKVFPVQQTPDGHTRKYLQKAKSGVRLYVPPRSLDLLNDLAIPLYVTEGEKKCLRAAQDGLCCVGLGGIWNWKESGDEDVIDDLQRIPMLGREVIIVPDSDFITNRGVLTAVYRLGKALERLGAKALIIGLIGDGTENKVGLDDYLNRHKVESLKAIKAIGLTHGLFKSNGLTTSKAPEPRSSPEAQELLDSEGAKMALRPAQDFLTDKLWFGIALHNGRLFIDSKKNLVKWQDMQEAYAITDKNFSRSSFSRDGIKRFMDSAQHKSPAELYEEIREHFARHMVFKHKSVPGVIALWVMGTYCYMLFKWYGYIWINSPTKRCGKSLLLELLAHTAFNCPSTMISPSVPFLFREVSANGATILIDELEKCRDQDKEKSGDLMALMNGGCKKGNVVPRVEKEGEIFKTVYFHSYGPKAFAGINQVTDTMADRSIKVHLLRKKKNEKIQRLNLNKLEPHLFVLRDNLHIFALQFAMEISDLYGSPETLNMPEELDDRAKDIFEPLFALATLVDRHAGGAQIEAVKNLQTFATQQADIRSDRESNDDSITQVVSALQGIPMDASGKAFITPTELLPIFQRQPGLEWLEGKKGAGGLMRRLGLKSVPSRYNGGKPARGYMLTQAILIDLADRYPMDVEQNNASDPDLSVTSVTPDGNSDKLPSVTEGVVTDQAPGAKSAPPPTISSPAVTGVTDKKSQVDWDAINRRTF